MSQLFLCPICRKYKTKRKDHLEKHLLNFETKRHLDESDIVTVIKRKLYRLYPHKYQKPPPEPIHNVITMDGLKHEIDQMKEGLNSLRDQKPTINVTIKGDVNQTQINNNVHLHFWGQINKDMLDSDFMRQMIQGAIPHNASEMFEHVFYNEGYPENFIVYLPNKKLSDVQVFTDQGWKLIQDRQICHTFLEKTYRQEMYQVLDHFLEHNLVTESEHEDLSNRLYEDDHADDIHQDIRRIMINHRDKVKPTYQQTKKSAIDQTSKLLSTQQQLPKALSDPTIKIPALKIIPKKKIRIRHSLK